MASESQLFPHSKYSPVGPYVRFRVGRGQPPGLLPSGKEACRTDFSRSRIPLRWLCRGSSWRGHEPDGRGSGRARSTQGTITMARPRTLFKAGRGVRLPSSSRPTGRRPSRRRSRAPSRTGGRATIPIGRESHTHSMKWRRDLLDALITLAVGVGVACALGALFVWLWAPPPTPENSSPPPEPFLFLFGAVVGLVVTLVARVLFGRLVLQRKHRVG